MSRAVFHSSVSLVLAGLLLLSSGVSRAAEEPASPVKLAGIEMGATGIKAAVIELSRLREGGFDFEVIWRDEKNVSLGTLTPDGLEFTPEALTQTREAIKTLAGEIEKKYGLKAAQITVVGSSGIFSGFHGNEKAIAGARAALTRELGGAGFTPGFIDVVDEAKLGALALLPAPLRSQTLLVDIGGGNTKGGYFRDGDFVNFGIDFGTKTFFREAEKAAKKADKTLAEVAEQTADKVVVPRLQAQLMDHPGLIRTPRVALVGGTMWAMATFTHPEKVGSARVDIRADDLDRFFEVAKDLTLPEKGEERLKKILAAIPDDKTRERAAREMKNVQKVYSPDQLVAGAALLRAVGKEFRFTEKKQIVFCNASQAWLVGYLMKKNGVEK